MNQRLKVGDTVQVTPEYISKDLNTKYLYSIGTIVKDDQSEIPFKVNFLDVDDYDWFKVDDLELVPSESPIYLQNIKYIILGLMDGKIFYTQNGTKVHIDKGMFKFGTSPLNLEKLVEVKLYAIDHSKPPFYIDKIKGTHCQVWDSEESKKSNIYRLVHAYVPSDKFKFKTPHDLGWKYAEPVK